jgi:valyl-tRNA synthetase
LQQIEWTKQFILGVRRIRSEMDINPGKQLSVFVQNGSPQDKQQLESQKPFLMSLARLATISWLDADATPPESAITLVGDMRVLIPLAGLIDKQAELQRLGKEIDKLCKELEKLTTKLENPKFIARAPADIVEKDKQRVAEMSASLQQLQGQQVKIQGL